MSWTQKEFKLDVQSRGSYLITDKVLKSVPEIKEYKCGLLNLFIKHTSCALSLNENCKKRRGRQFLSLIPHSIVVLTSFLIDS